MTKDKLEDCKCINYDDKVKIIGALIDTKGNLEKKTIKTLDKTSEAYKTIMNEIIPEYDDLLDRLGNTPDCKYKFD